MLSEWMAYLQFVLGAQHDASGHIVADTSLSAQLQSSERLWMLLEAAHVLTLMLFAGTILFVDLRLLGVALRGVPVSRVSAAVLPYTIGGFVVLLVTGLALFFSNPFEYYHNLVLRLRSASSLPLRSTSSCSIAAWRRTGKAGTRRRFRQSPRVSRRASR